jgi:uncharacterized membrane protein
MKFKKNKFKNTVIGGFVATIAVVLLSTGILAFSLVTMASAISYADGIYRRELRIQTTMNAKACLDTVTLMAVKDYFIVGDIDLDEFGCQARIENDFFGNIALKVRAKLSGIESRADRVIKMSDNDIEIIE